jgi:hypothetical protein
MWDSGFIVMGFAHFDVEKAKNEIKNILNAQWENGYFFFMFSSNILVYI